MQHETEDEEDAVPEEEIAADAGVGECDHDFEAHGGDDEGLVVGEADAEQEESPEQVAALVLGMDPSQEAAENPHQREHAQGIDLDDDGLAPHETIETDQQAGDVTGGDAQGVLPAPVDVLEFLESLEDHAGAAGGQEGNEPARERTGDGGGQGDSPGDVREGHEHGEKPGVEGPDGIARGVRHTGVMGSDRELARVFEGQIGCQREEVPREDQESGEPEGEPIDAAEEGLDRGSRSRVRLHDEIEHDVGEPAETEAGEGEEEDKSPAPGRERAALGEAGADTADDGVFVGFSHGVRGDGGTS